MFRPDPFPPIGWERWGSRTKGLRRVADNKCAAQEWLRMKLAKRPFRLYSFDALVTNAQS